jgi:hypothetical protein
MKVIVSVVSDVAIVMAPQRFAGVEAYSGFHSSEKRHSASLLPQPRPSQEASHGRIEKGAPCAPLFASPFPFCCTEAWMAGPTPSMMNEVLVFDGAVSALDVTVQSQILALLDELQRDCGLTYPFVSHDLAVVRRISDSVSVLRAGRIVETGSVEAIFARPSSPYTRELTDAVPGRALSGEVQQRKREPIAASGA